MYRMLAGIYSEPEFMKLLNFSNLHLNSVKFFNSVNSDSDSLFSPAAKYSTAQAYHIATLLNSQLII